MSVNISVFIEVKNKKTDKWELIQGKTDHLYYGGAVRDFFSNEVSWAYSDRGFPEDASDGLKDILDKEQKEIEKESAKYSTKHFECHDFRYHKSWITMDEVIDLYDEKVEKWKQYLREEINRKQIREITDELKEIKAILQKETIKSSHDEEEYDALEEMIGDNLMDNESIGEFISSVHEIIRFMTDEYFTDSKDIRLTYYFD